MRLKSIVLSLMLFTLLIYSCQEMSPPIAPDNQQADVQSQTLKKGGDLAVESVDKGTPYILANHYVVEFNGSVNSLKDAVAELGGSIDKVHPQIGVAMVSGIDDQQAGQLNKKAGISHVTRDMIVQWVDPEQQVFDMVSEQGIGDDETFFGYQWNLQAIDAPEAWETGARGAGVRVAVLDGGISSNHVDLDDNIDFAASASFVPGFNFDEDVTVFRHASHVAGIIAAEDNGRGTIGVAPEATIIALKVLHNSSGSFAWLINAVIYAADFAEADVINMSLGAFYPRNNNGAAKLNTALGHAMNYAHQKGVTIIASAGNGGIDFDHAYMYLYSPAEIEHVLAISATGPVGFAYGYTNFDRPASYTNFGQSLVDFAGPGGDYVLYDQPYWYYDMVLSPGFVGDDGLHYYSFAAGTSMSAPAVAGVAALVIGQNGGEMNPSQVKAILKQSADDLGKPGNDDYYGQGRVNAYKAVLQ